jgi:two-component system alkaline phosphatase synthesis response regulator PhoP
MYKITIVEDELSILELYKFKFENEGFEVTTAINGAIGLEVAKNTLPDLILLDLMMPVMDGNEMLKKLREQKWGANIRVIILTNLSKNEAPMALRLLYVDRYIIKAHTTPNQLVETVREVLDIDPLA